MKALPMSDFPPTDEQEEILAFVAGNPSSSLSIAALAGTGKTSTLRLLAPKLPSSPAPLALAFNKRISEALKLALPSSFEIQTLNALGHRAWGRLVGKKLQVDKHKPWKIVREQVIASSGSVLPKEEQAVAVSLLNAARIHGMTPEGKAHIGVKTFLEDSEAGWETIISFLAIPDPHPETLAVARSALKSSVEAAYAGSIDFLDQQFMTACFSGSLPRFATILLDEAQDVSVLDAEMLRRTASGKVILVGDAFQSIYGFRGSQQNAIENLTAQFSAASLPLTTCFRCSKAVVAEAALIVPTIRAFEKAPEGSVRELDRNWSLDTFSPNCAVLCRNSAPLFRLAFALLAEQRQIAFNGKDIGARIRAFIGKVSKDETRSSSELLKWLEEYIEKLPESRRNSAEDILECVAAIPGGTVTEILINLEKLLLQDSGNINLSTIHGAKGLEWDTVFLLDRKLMQRKLHDPNVPASTKQQERNLEYVAVTRAKKHLYFITSQKRERRNNEQDEAE